ncbi:MAG TPA: nuclear transport factor 2 family protein [Puia sp.]|nr:nuclear transport factor 2 family protein [Puia sp.]
MQPDMHDEPAKPASEQLVLDFINALNRERFAEARDMLSDDFQFVGVLGKRDGADAYMDDMKKMKMKYAVKMVFTNGDDIAVLMDLTISGKTVENFAWYHVGEDHLTSLKVLFDPRPLLQGTNKN